MKHTTDPARIGEILLILERARVTNGDQSPDITKPNAIHSPE